ncbi:MAG: hypothetical protein ACD_54C01208G0001 [uncultured bacterium]|nr:MAG: hypothetical protein ACD_54C01208G0001 [uncultured bacterium]
MPNMIHSTAFSISLSAKTTKGDLPPSSRLMFFTSRAAVAINRAPVGTEPVKASLSTPGCSAIACPTSAPRPVTMFSTPGGKPAALTISPSSSAVSEVCSEGFSTMQQPAASAGATFHAAISKG